MTDRHTGMLIIMAKQPRAGAVKTRLCPPLTPAQAEALYSAFLRDTILLVAAAAQLAGVTPALAYAPPDAEGYFRALVPNSFVLLPQLGADLGARLRNLPAQARAAGFTVAVMISSDSPTLPPALVARTFSELARPDVDVVLGPCTDGGYYLIGLNADQPALFTGISWSTDQVMGQTLAAAAGAGLRVALLPSWFDTDTADDLLRLQRDLADDPAGAPHTRAALGPPFVVAAQRA